MRKLLPTLLLLSLGALVLPSCSDSQADFGGPKIKVGGSPYLPYGTCKGMALDALQFFQGQSTGDEREVFATELKQRIDTGQPTLIVDVRPVPEYSAAHIPTSVNIPLDVLFDQGLCPNGNGYQCEGPNDDLNCKAIALPIDGMPIVFVSSNGHAASIAAGLLGTMGYNIYVLRFGMVSWAKSLDVQVHRADKTQRIQGLGGPLEL